MQGLFSTVLHDAMSSLQGISGGDRILIVSGGTKHKEPPPQEGTLSRYRSETEILYRPHLLTKSTICPKNPKHTLRYIEILFLSFLVFNVLYLCLFHWTLLQFPPLSPGRSSEKLDSYHQIGREPVGLQSQKMC